MNQFYQNPPRILLSTPIAERLTVLQYGWGLANYFALLLIKLEFHIIQEQEQKEEEFSVPKRHYLEIGYEISFSNIIFYLFFKTYNTKVSQLQFVRIYLNKLLFK